jgi:polysaccharide deacetylase family protein (PEP-CTERM system associated)
VLNAFTVDVEDWFDGIPIPADEKAAAERRLNVGMETLLCRLDERSVLATFFFLGPTALAYPGLVRELAEAGHEIGCHGWSHEFLYEMTPERFRQETRDAKRAVEDAAGAPVTAYRAAYFSITEKSLWAFEVLAEVGFECDSSVFPVRNWRYGIPDFELRPGPVDTPSGSVYEFPMSVVDYPGRRLAATGGAYFRIYPYALTRAHVRRLSREGRPVVFYLHPWELDPSHPRVPFHWKPRLTHYWNLSSTAGKLSNLLADFDFAPLRKVMANELEQHRP